MFLLLFTVSVLLGNIQAFTREDANEYMDNVLNGRFNEEATYSRLDPYKLDDIQVALNHTGVQKGKALLHKGHLIHLSKVRRSADCTEPFYQSSNITFTCFLRFDKLQINYTANATFENMEASFYPHVKVLGTNVTVQITSNHEEDIPNLKLLFINRIGSMDVTAEMLSIGNLAIIIGPPIREALEWKTTRSLYLAIGGRFKDALAYSIYKTPVGFEN